MALRRGKKSQKNSECDASLQSPNTSVQQVFGDKNISGAKAMKKSKKMINTKTERDLCICDNEGYLLEGAQRELQ